MNKLDLDPGVIAACRAAAKAIAADVTAATRGLTTTSIERTVTRFLGVDGVDKYGVPFPNILIDHIRSFGGLSKGAAYWVGNAMMSTGMPAMQVAHDVASGKLDLNSIPRADPSAVRSAVRLEHERSLNAIKDSRLGRREKRQELLDRPGPLLYVLTATGNVYDDIDNALAVAENGGDIVAMIRSTAQSLLDYVPYGATTEGFGGTFATQENFRLVRKALDDWSHRHGKYMMLSSFASGLCMPEISAVGAMEGLDNMVNDALYGILYRDINIRRALVDQRFSRMINGYFELIINTGEDNYLRTADQVEAAPSVVASQLINYYLAIESGIPPHLIAVGNAFEINPALPGGLLLEWAHAQVTRELFPDCLTKYMPPTKHMDGNPLRTHACDAMFNLITVATGQSIQTIGTPTEGVHTPHIHDRVFGLENIRYVTVSGGDLADEIQFRPGGVIQRRAHQVLDQARDMLEHIAAIGLFAAIGEGRFGAVRRGLEDGRGGDGIEPTDDDYFNPCAEVMEERNYAANA